MSLLGKSKLGMMRSIFRHFFSWFWPLLLQTSTCFFLGERTQKEPVHYVVLLSWLYFVFRLIVHMIGYLVPKRSRGCGFSLLSEGVLIRRRLGLLSVLRLRKEGWWWWRAVMMLLLASSVDSPPCRASAVISVTKCCLRADSGPLKWHDRSAGIASFFLRALPLPARLRRHAHMLLHTACNCCCPYFLSLIWLVILGLHHCFLRGVKLIERLLRVISSLHFFFFFFVNRWWKFFPLIFVCALFRGIAELYFFASTHRARRKLRMIVRVGLIQLLRVKF